METAFVILALATPFMVAGAFFMGTVVGHRLSQNQSPATAPVEMVAAAKAAVQSVIPPAPKPVAATEEDEYEAERRQNSERIREALATYGVTQTQQ